MAKYLLIFNVKATRTTEWGERSIENSGEYEVECSPEGLSEKISKKKEALEAMRDQLDSPEYPIIAFSVAVTQVIKLS